jgi:hypothetical protein
VIYADGDIVDGKSMTIPFIGRKLVGGETIAGLIAAARVSPAVDAIVLRIDSPGGSALASELMSREVFKTRGVKPIVCSMGDLAASAATPRGGVRLIYTEPWSPARSGSSTAVRVSGVSKLSVDRQFKRSVPTWRVCAGPAPTRSAASCATSSVPVRPVRRRGCRGRAMKKSAVVGSGGARVVGTRRARPAGRSAGRNRRRARRVASARAVGDGSDHLLHLPRADKSLLGKLIGSFLRSERRRLGLGIWHGAAVLDLVPPSVWSI